MKKTFDLARFIVAYAAYLEIKIAEDKGDKEKAAKSFNDHKKADDFKTVIRLQKSGNPPLITDNSILTVADKETCEKYTPNSFGSLIKELTDFRESNPDSPLTEELIGKVRSGLSAISFLGEDAIAFYKGILTSDPAYSIHTYPSL